MNTLWQDLRYSVRLLRKNLSFTAVAVLMLALGIGANTAIFQLINAVRLRTLPVKNPEELVEVRIADTTGARGGWASWHATATNPIWEQIRENQQSFSSILAWGSDRWVNLASGGEARFAQTVWVSGDFGVARIDPAAATLDTPIAIGPTGTALATTGDAVWVVQRRTGALLRLSP